MEMMADVAGFLLQLLLIDGIAAAAWLAILWLPSRPFPEKRGFKTLLPFFAAGMLSVFPALLLYRVLGALEVTLPDTWGTSLFYEVGFVGPFEEFSKFLVFFLVSRRMKSIHEPVDGLVQAGAVGLGFAIVENFKYGLYGGTGLLVERSFITPTGHVVFAMLWGFGYVALTFGAGKRRLRDTMLVFLFIFPAALVHGFSNFLIPVQPELLYWVFEASVDAFAIVLLLFAVRRSPLGHLQLSDARRAAADAEAALGSNGSSFLLARRAGLAHLAAANYPRAALLVDRGLRLNPGDPFCHAMKGMLLVLQGEVAAGEGIIGKSFSLLSLRQASTLLRIARLHARHPQAAGERGNAVNEFLLDQFLRGFRELALRV
jgi:RsiW-degrading membrane proteinase PrsW (M82 family)